MNGYIDPSAKIGDNCRLGKNVVVLTDVQLGDSVVIGHNVVIYSGTAIGEGTVIGRRHGHRQAAQAQQDEHGQGD